jgi:tripartite-type tricarboxylate transporter receptor subunit TctC
VPYRGAAPALADLVAGQVQAKLDNYTTSAPFVADKRLNALAVTSDKRLKQLPDVPTVMESVPGFDGYLWMGLVAPAGTPQAVIDKLAAAAKRAVALPEVQARFDKDAVEPVGNGPAEFKALVAREIAQWRELAKQTDIKLE